jgi:hypothetical protein
MNRKIFKFTAIFALAYFNLGFLPGTMDVAFAEVIKLNPQPQSIPLPVDAYKDSFIVAKGENGLQQSAYIIYTVVGALRYLIAGVATLLGLTGVIQLLLAKEKEESLTKAKTIILYSVLGIILIALSNDLAKIMDLSGGGLLGTKEQIASRLNLFDNTVRIVITFSKYLIGAVATLMLIITGMEMVTMGDSEDEMGKSKKNIGYILGGLFLLIFVDNIIRNVFYKIDRPGQNVSVDLAQGVKELVGFTNLLVSFVGPIAIITLVAGGLMYVASFGNEETQGKAKKMMITSLVGIVAIYGAFGVVSTIITGSL